MGEGGDTNLRLNNPLAPSKDEVQDNGIYARALTRGRVLSGMARRAGAGATARQHSKNRMTVWERLSLLADDAPYILYQNWGQEMDGASLVTAIATVNGRKVAFYGHDFTVRAGSMDANNGAKLARLFAQAGKLGIPLIGMNDSAGAYVPAGVGGLDGYAEAFTALRRLSGVVPSIMCMFGFNAGGGSYLPRQGSFVIQPRNTFFGLTGPGVVESVLGEKISADDLGGPAVHGASGVADFISEDEYTSIRLARDLLDYLPDNNRSLPKVSPRPLADPPDRSSWELSRLLETTFASPAGLNTPMNIRSVLQAVCDHGDLMEVQSNRAPNTITAFGRLGGYVTGLVANNSAVMSGQIDVAAAYKNTHFIRFCNLYNIPLVFFEDTTGFLPGQEQETAGIVQAGRAMLDAIIDVRTPRFLVVVRNAFGGAYASYNNYNTGADLVLALPCARVAVMGTAGVEFVYKDELRANRAEFKKKAEKEGVDKAEKWLAAQKARLDDLYEKDLMNPEAALSLGSISAIVEPQCLRAELTRNMTLFMDRYTPNAMASAQREFY